MSDKENKKFTDINGVTEELWYVPGFGPVIQRSYKDYEKWLETMRIGELFIMTGEWRKFFNELFFKMKELEKENEKLKNELIVRTMVDTMKGKHSRVVEGNKDE